MSLSPPREGLNSNNDGDFDLYWCYQCHRAVRISARNPSEITCPRCYGQFVSQLDWSRRRLVLDYPDYDASPESRLIEALALMIDQLQPRPRRRDRPVISLDGEENGVGADGNGRMRGRLRPRFPLRLPTRRDNPEMDLERPPPEFPRIPRSIVVLTGPPDRRPPAAGPFADPVLTRLSGALLPPGVDPRNYFIGTGLNELIEELTENDRPGPPPAAESSIDAIPTVKVTPEHLGKNELSSCPVCMETFGVGEEAKELPCKHVYHEDCIVPWLRLHNSCPVCRCELPQVPAMTVSRGGGEEEEGRGSEEDERIRRRCLNWDRMWPFRGRYRPLSRGATCSEPPVFCHIL